MFSVMVLSRVFCDDAELWSVMMLSRVFCDDAVSWSVFSSDLLRAVEEVLPVLKEQQVTVLLLAESCDTDGIVCFSVKINAASDERPPISLRSNVTLNTPALFIYTSGHTCEIHA